MEVLFLQIGKPEIYDKWKLTLKAMLLLEARLRKTHA